MSIKMLRLEGANVLVDADVYEWAQHVRWKIGDWNYAVNPSGVPLHRLILGLEVGDARQGDHKNGNKLDCRRSNLRVVTYAQNRQNERARRTYGGVPPASKYRGVFWSRNRWLVQHYLEGKCYYGGTYTDEEEANQAAIAWRKQHMSFSTN